MKSFPVLSLSGYLSPVLSGCRGGRCQAAAGTNVAFVCGCLFSSESGCVVTHQPHRWLLKFLPGGGGCLTIFFNGVCSVQNSKQSASGNSCYHIVCTQSCRRAPLLPPSQQDIVVLLLLYVFHLSAILLHVFMDIGASFYFLLGSLKTSF